MPKGRNTKLKLYCLEQWIKAINIVKTPRRLAEEDGQIQNSSFTKPNRGKSGKRNG